MSEQQFVEYCKENKLDNIYKITNNKFLNIPNIIGCNKVNNEYIVYYTDEIGTIKQIYKLENEYYTFEFLFRFSKNMLAFIIGYEDDLDNKGKQKIIE